MPTSWAFASSVCSALLLAACGGGGPVLTVSELVPVEGLRDVPDRRTGGSVDAVPTWRAEGGSVSFALRVTNRGPDPVEIVGTVRDEDGDDQQFVPGGIDGSLLLAAGASGRVEVAGRADCNGRMPGQVSGKNGQRFRLGDGGTADVDLGALIEFVCPR